MSLEALPPAKVQLLDLLKKKRTYLQSLYKTLQGNQSEWERFLWRWNQLFDGALRHLVDLTTIEYEIAEILKPNMKDKEKQKVTKRTWEKW